MANSSTFPHIRTGTDDFKTLLLHSDVFVDKSLMIQALLEESSEVILITRPRRWGKSLNMDMIRKFFEIEVNEQGEALPETDKHNHLLFIGGEANLGFGETKMLYPLKIADNTHAIKRQGQFPVILLNLKDVKGNSYQEIEAGIKNQLIKVFIQHRYLKRYITEDKYCSLDEIQKEKLASFFTGKLNKETLKDGLVFLSELLYKHFNQKVYILIDEYDTPINYAYIKFGQQKEAFEEVLELFRGMLGSALKSNPYLEKGLITGILRIAKANIFSDLNNVREYTLLDKKFTQFYGFTQAEVDKLLTQVPTQTAPAKIKDWYNGYTFGGEVIYNPWSIMQCLASEGILDYYWLDSGGTGLVNKVLLDDLIQEDIKKLLEGKSIVKMLNRQIWLEEIETNPNAFYSLLLFAGYLNPMLSHDATAEEPRYYLTIPNKEVRGIYIERVIKWVHKKLNMRMDSYDNFIELLTSNQMDAFGAKLQAYLLNATSYHDLSQERDYHNLIGGLLAPLINRYHIVSNQEAGYGRCDHLLIARAEYGDHAWIIEHKVAKDPKDLNAMAEEGLHQIKNKQYAAALKTHDHIKKITHMAMAFCGKKVTFRYFFS
ncbi:AAA family ATPase [Candidatus Cardinium hertigii]|jgi:hypothetical protein|uniref:AAA-ATPase-like domain-containing protein n=1 Tax=Candidatus Cardinium hertigii TaxID=247481 RepID=A0A3N2QC92_9BACT|nr:AAA family ATPase [Candidatus Cardinium hertigii]ROT47414.1 hypothetical protein EDM02_03200 [Candidatus Cardinium hertigii]